MPTLFTTAPPCRDLHRGHAAPLPPLLATRRRRARRAASLATYVRYAVLLACVWFATGCASSYKASQAETNASAQTVLHREALAAVARFKRKDPSIQRFFANSYGYAIFPSVAKGGLGLGGAYGKGEVYEKGNLVGYTSLTQGTIGLQLGGQVYSELIFFKDQATLNDFKWGHFEFSAQVSAVAATAGASANADYEEGVAIFTLAKSGLMYEASIGGQKFSYVAK